MGKIVNSVSNIAGGILNPTLGLATSTLKAAGKAAGVIKAVKQAAATPAATNPAILAQTMLQAARTPIARRNTATNTPPTWLSGSGGQNGQTLGGTLGRVSLLGSVMNP